MTHTESTSLCSARLCGDVAEFGDVYCALHRRMETLEQQAAAERAAEDDEPEALDLDVIARRVRDAGYPCVVEQTGGGCATILAGTVDTSTGSYEAPVLAGPGSFGWGERPSVADPDEFYVGFGDDEDAVAEACTTEDEAVEAIVTLLQSIERNAVAR